MRLALAVAVLSSGCVASAPGTDASSPAEDASAPADAAAPPVLPITGCPGARPVDDADCVQGDGWRDCGGVGAPRFGCAPGTQDCAWFEGGCVPTSWDASPCPAEELCCVGGWAFAPDALDEDARGRVAFLLSLRGRAPVDRVATARVGVVVDPALEVGAELALTCRGEPSSLCPTRDPRLDPWPLHGGADRSDDTLSLVGHFEDTHGGTRLLVEVDPDEPARARACIASYGDARWPTCPPDPPPRCADEGTLTITALPAPRSGPAAIAARLDARFGDLEVTFELPP